MLCPWPNIVLNQLTAQLTSMWYIPLLMDPVSSASSQKTPSIPRCTNVLTSSHRLPFNFAVGFHLCRQRQQPAIHQLGLVIQRSIDRELSLRSKPKGVPTAPSPGSTSGTPGSKLKSSRPPDARGVLERNTRDFRSASGSPYLHVLGDQAGQCVCVLHPIHIVASRLVACLSAVQALCSLTDQALELPLCQHRGAPLHLHQRCARQSCLSSLRVTNSACWFRLTSQLS